jgi:hypothetical protein
MSTIPYIPTTDSGLDAWSLNFSTLISANPAQYGLTPPDAAAIAVAQAAFAAAYLLGGSSGSPPAPVNPSTFTSVTVAAKNSAKISMTVLARTYASQIRLDPGVLNADKTALGLNLPNNSPSPIPAPATFPVLTIVAIAQGLMQLRYADNLTPASRKKPDGALQMELWRGIDPAVIITPTACTLVAVVTKQPYVSSFASSLDAGKKATFFARWLTRRGLFGPWSAGVSATISF